MSFEIDAKFTELAILCPKWKICLTGDLSHCGEIISLEGDNLLMNPTPDCQVGSCTKHFKLSNQGQTVHVCICPVRKEIYKKYGE